MNQLPGASPNSAVNQDEQVLPHPMIGGSHMGQHVRETDWSATALGAYETWPQSLRSALSLVLNAKGIAALYWGPEQLLLYNDAYGAAIGDRHPKAFGRPMPEALPDIAPILGPQVAEVLRTGTGFAIENLSMTMHRHGRDEETIWTYSFSPVQGERGDFAGVLLLATEMTQQKTAERSADTIRTRLETALRVARLGTFDWQPSTGIIEVDARGREMFDLPADGVLTQEDTFGNMVPEDMERVQHDAAAVMGIDQPFDGGNLGRTIDFDYDVVHADGSRRSIVSSGTILQNEDGTRRMIGAFNDVTDLKLAEKQLLAQNATLADRVEQRTQERDRIWQLSGDMLGVADEHGVWLSINPAWTRTLGWHPGDIIGRTSEWMEHPDDVAKTRSEIGSIAAGNTTSEFVNRFRTIDGDHRMLSWTAVPDNGLMYCVARDITEQEKGLAALRDRDSSWQLTRDLMLRCTFDGTMTAVNPAWNEVLGWKQEELLGVSLFDLIHPDDMAHTIEGARQLSEGIGHARFDNRYRHKDGSYRWIAWSTRAVDGQINASGRDFTAEEAQREALVQSQEALRQSQKMEAVGQLTGGLAHDFNNLLAGISGSLDMMQTRIQQGRIAEIDRYMIGAQGAAKRAAALTHRLLAFSRRQTLEPKPTDVNRLVTGMEDLIQRTVGPQITIETVTTGGLWPALVDPNQLENALLNLCINARDALPEGGQIVIETANRWLDERAAQERDLPPGQYLSMCVSDNGTGMPKDVIERAFDPFFTTKPIGVGTGLGLSMIYGFTRQSGGQVRIYSEVGRGTRVCLYLPRHHVQEVFDAPMAVESIVRTNEARSVLVIDDEPLVRMLVVDAVEDLGHTALEAGDGPQGLKMLRSITHLDLLITDVGLPNGMNGRQVADAARELRPDLKVLFVTGYAENAVLSHGHLDPGMQVVTKPFDMATLSKRIQAMIMS